MKILVILMASLIGLQDQKSSSTWVQVSPERAGASVRLPGNPREYSRDLTPVKDQDPIVVRNYQATLPDGSATMVFSYHDEHQQPRNRQKIKEYLDGAIKGGVARVLGKLEDQTEIVIGKHRGREFTYTCTQNEQNLKIRSRVIIVGKRVYQMNYIAKMEHFDEQFGKQMFDSFKLENIPQDLPPIPRPGRAKS